MDWGLTDWGLIDLGAKRPAFGISMVTISSFGEEHGQLEFVYIEGE